jgi:hypothetical protein
MSHAPKEMVWAYRSTGPFSLPQRAYGVYTVLLTLRFFARVLNCPTTPLLSWSKPRLPAAEGVPPWSIRCVFQLPSIPVRLKALGFLILYFHESGSMWALFQLNAGRK